MATLGSKAVGAIVKLNVDGVATNFIVVHQGNPDTAIYDASCDGTWLLMQNCYAVTKWDDAGTNNYGSSSIYPYLNGTFFNKLDPKLKEAVKQVKIPYRAGSGNGQAATGGADGLSTKIFLLSGSETNINDSSFPSNEGYPLSYFRGCSSSGSDSKRIARLNNTAMFWWLRSPYISYESSKKSTHAMGISSNGGFNSYSCNATQGVRPVLIFPCSLFVSDDGTVSTNTPPTIPSSITVPTTVIGSQNLTVSWGSSTDSDGNLSGYILERKADSGAWTQVYKGSSRSATVSITYGWNSVQFRVKAYDTNNAESSYKTSDTRTVTNNRTPVISGSNSNLGNFSETAPSYPYTVTDADGDTVTVVETLDGTTQRSYTVTLGTENTFTLSSEAWQKVLNGSHTLAIKATDSNGASVTRTLTFTKAVTSVSFEQTVAMPADDMPMKALLNIQGSFPVGSILKVEICNNGNDAEPTWEDVTTRVLNGQKCYFSNTEKTAESWGVKIRVNLSRGTATEPCYIQTLGGNFG